MKTKIGIAVLVVALTAAVACSSSQVSVYVNLADQAVVNGLQLAKSFGVNVTQTVVDKVTSLSNDLNNAFAAWAGASANDKPGKWPAVETALDAFKTYLPQVLKDAQVPAQDQVYATIVTLAINAVEAAVNLIEQQNPASGKLKATKPVNAKQLKKDYNQQMISVGHPELQLK